MIPIMTVFRDPIGPGTLGGGWEGPRDSIPRDRKSWYRGPRSQPPTKTLGQTGVKGSRLRLSRKSRTESESRNPFGGLVDRTR